MEMLGWIALSVAGGLIAILAVVYFAWRPYWGLRQEKMLIRARREFHLRREGLEAHFVQRAANSGKPRGLRWVDCDFDDDVTYARDRHSGRLSAFVATTISFEAVEGGGMEDVEAVSNLRGNGGVQLRRKDSLDDRRPCDLQPEPGRGDSVLSGKLGVGGAGGRGQVTLAISFGADPP